MKEIKNLFKIKSWITYFLSVYKPKQQEINKRKDIKLLWQNSMTSYQSSSSRYKERGT